MRWSLLWLSSVLLGLVVLGVDDGAPALRTPAPVDDGNPARLEELGGLDCARCHVAIAQEWAETRHATAWVDERYQKELKKKRRPESCHGCHIPELMHAGDLGRKPAPRDEAVEAHRLGISCRSCHEAPDGAMLGPWGAPTDAHASRQGASFVEGDQRNQLCIACHRTTIGPVIGIAKDFEVSGQAGKGRSCVGCHMAPVERPAATVDGEPTQARPGRSHLLQTPRDPYFLALAFDVAARREGDDVVVAITNDAGHRIPGLTERSMTFRAQVLDAAGETQGEAQGEATLEITSQAYLPVDDTNEIRIRAPGTRVRVLGDHVTPGVEQPIRFLDRTFELDG